MADRRMYKKTDGNLFCTKLLGQGSPTFSKLIGTSCVRINPKNYQFDTRFWNKNVAQFPFVSVVTIKIFHNVKTLIMLMLFLKQASE